MKSKKKFIVGDVVNATVVGKIYSVSEEDGKIMYGVEWTNARGLKLKTLHQEHLVQG